MGIWHRRFLRAGFLHESAGGLSNRENRKADLFEVVGFCVLFCHCVRPISNLPFELQVFRVNLPCFDRDIQMIFLRREGAGGVLSERAGRAIGFVKVNEYFAVLVRISVMITTGWVRRVAIGQVHELDEEAAVGFLGTINSCFCPPTSKETYPCMGSSRIAPRISGIFTIFGVS